MENPALIALSRQTALERHLAVVSNNLANMNTTGYRAERMIVNEYRRDYGFRHELSFVQDVSTPRVMTDGPVKRSGNMLDVAINGPGFFVVDAPAGERFTRNGIFSLDRQNRMVTTHGHVVLDQSNNPIVLPGDASEILISGDGVVSVAGQRVAQLRIVGFANDHMLKPAGDSIYSSETPPQNVAQPRVIQHATEEANVQPIAEMTQMIEILRNYQATQRLIDAEHERERAAVRRLSSTTQA
ncbi:MAG: flagellar hook-basal body complex protein [Alphaproteobacteria bacterium]|nr:flagellar hook-basal body complex protein [Alphaproteobacteria bacterium]